MSIVGHATLQNCRLRKHFSQHLVVEWRSDGGFTIQNECFRWLTSMPLLNVEGEGGGWGDHDPVGAVGGGACAGDVAGMDWNNVTNCSPIQTQRIVSEERDVGNGGQELGDGRGYFVIFS